MTRAARPLDLTLTYTLTSADALAWETRRREVTGWGRIVFLLWLGLAGLILAFVPEDWVGPENGWRFYLWLVGLIGVQWGLAALLMTAMAQVKARRRVPEPVLIRLDIFPARLVERRDLAEPVVITPDDIANVLTRSGHVIVATRRDVVIVPARAFADEAAMAGFAKRWDALSHEATP
ncbi:hypothetical protein L0V05_04365 [Tabrizicola sp. J26]|uniref:hypothetical protein n=1 Tax=Alitabrizicola rongguiensis TaxID=2909234 RepID=UPI001F3EBEF5|nr:hypothetical protein [Tabrizicola rongguiensis]MCF1708048.1 hypothetical protein [Tabrizicola rongguiensis]